VKPLFNWLGGDDVPRDVDESTFVRVVTSDRCTLFFRGDIGLSAPHPGEESDKAGRFIWASSHSTCFRILYSSAGQATEAGKCNDFPTDNQRSARPKHRTQAASTDPADPHGLSPNSALPELRLPCVCNRRANS